MVDRVTYTVTEAAAATGMSPSGIRKAMSEGVIPTVTVGRRKLVPAGWVRSLGETQAATPLAVASAT